MRTTRTNIYAEVFVKFSGKHSILIHLKRPQRSSPQSMTLAEVALVFGR
jgi:hypothetical protein